MQRHDHPHHEKSWGTEDDENSLVIALFVKSEHFNTIVFTKTLCCFAGKRS